MDPQNQLSKINSQLSEVKKQIKNFRNIKDANLYRGPHVDGDFNCRGNKLTSLEFAPEKVGGNFDCSYNKLTSLKYTPKKVGRQSFDCGNNKLSTLEFCPQEIKGDFNCRKNNLSSLDFFPLSVGGGVDISYNKLSSLKLSPITSNRHFNCSGNKLLSLEFAPQKVGGNFDCSFNNLSSLEYSPTFIKELYNCAGNPIDFKNMEILHVCGSMFCFGGSSSILISIKNIFNLIHKIKSIHFQNNRFIFKFHSGDQNLDKLLSDLHQRYFMGENLEDLYVEGMNWCCDNGYPEDFWGIFY